MKNILFLKQASSIGTDSIEGLREAQAQATTQAATTASPEEEGLLVIESPMVGTFYSTPSPEKPAFVSVGDKVEPDTVICLIEAMKIFNEIKAEQTGSVAKILVNNGDSVEFGQPVMLIRPS